MHAYIGSFISLMCFVLFCFVLFFLGGGERGEGEREEGKGEAIWPTEHQASSRMCLMLAQIVSCLGCYKYSQSL